MSDPLSVAAGAIAFFQLSQTIIKYLSSIADAPDERQRLILEISGASGLLVYLNDQVATNTSTAGSAFSGLILPNGPLPQLKEALARLESKLAPSKSSHNALALLKWPFRKKEVLEILDAIERQKVALGLAIQCENKAISALTQKNTSTIQHAIETLRKDTELAQNETQRKAVLKWLSTTDISLSHQAALSKRQVGTGSWILNDAQYGRWKGATPDFPLLWLHGIPGCGKTVLCSTIVEDLIVHCSTDKNKSIAYFYFDFKDMQKYTFKPFVRSMVRQIAQNSKELHPELQVLYQDSQEGNQEPTVDSLLRSFYLMVENYPGQLYVIIDALDECMEQEDLSTFLEEMCSWNIAGIKMLCLSRRLRDIEDTMKRLSAAQISIQGARLRSDIQMLIQNQLSKERRLKKWPQSVRDEIEHVLLERAEGIYPKQMSEDQISANHVKVSTTYSGGDVCPDTGCHRGGTRRRYHQSTAVLTYLSFGQQAVYTVDPVNVHAMLTDRMRHKDFGVGTPRKQSFKPLFGSGIVTSDGAVWKHHRSMIRPFLSRVQAGQVDVFEIHVQNLIQALPADGSTVDLQRAFGALTLDISTHLFLGTSTNVLPSLFDSSSDSRKTRGEEFSAAFEYAQRTISGIDDFSIPGLLWKIIFGDRKLDKALRTLHLFIDVIIEQQLGLSQLANNTNNTNNTNKSQNFFSDLLDQGRSKEETRYDVLNLLLAEKDSNASFLTSILYVLCQRPDVCANIREEISILNRKPVTLEELSSFSYLRMVLQEVLRLYPPVAMNQRTAEVDTVLPRGGGVNGESPLRIPRGVSVGYSVYAMHRLPEYFWDKVDEFRPERWIDIKPPVAYMPFHAGLRTCPGQHVSMCLTKYLTIRMLQHYDRVEDRNVELWQEKLGLNCSSRHGALVGLVVSSHAE
ncbi:cytochrome P450 [Aspergillus spectabilis]